MKLKNFNEVRKQVDAFVVVKAEWEKRFCEFAIKWEMAEMKANRLMDSRLQQMEREGIEQNEAIRKSFTYMVKEVAAVRKDNSTLYKMTISTVAKVKEVGGQLLHIQDSVALPDAEIANLR